MQEDATISPDDINPTRKEKGELARMLVGIVDRKVIKQTVMTSVYGVTIIGARAQVQTMNVKSIFIYPDFYSSFKR